jgi:predicted transposase YdaD
MEMTKTVEKKVDEYDWMLVSYGKKRFDDEKKKCREEGEQSGFVKGEQSGFVKGEQSGFVKGEQSGFVKGEVEKSESIARNMLRSNYLPEEISRMTGLDIARIHQLAKESKP